MSFAYEDALFDLELDFFVHQPTTNYTVPELQAKIERLRKSIIFLKPRLRQLSHYVAAFKILTRELQGLKNSETQYKNICKQYLAEINVFTSKITLLEDEKLVAETREREKNEKIWELENKVIALQTIHTQLKLLVQEKNRSEFTPVKVIKKKCKVSAADKAQIRFLEKEIETLRKDNAKILNLQKENEKLHRDNARIPILEKEIENLLVSKSSKINDQYEITRIQQLEQEVETLRKENFKILKLEAEIEILNKDNANIPKFINEIGKLHKENAKIQKLEKDIEILNKDNANIPKYLKEIGKLQKENARILKLEKEIESLNKQNVQIPNLMKEIGNLRKENVKITKLEKEIESLNKENESLKAFKKNAEISNFVKDIETLHIKNGEIDIVNKAFSKEIVIIPDKGEEIASHLNNPTLTIKEKGELSPMKSNHTQKYKSLPESNSGCSDNSEAENYEYEDPLLSLTPNNTIAILSPIADEYIAVPHESDNENSNEVISIDTGRGSSLANSEIEKGLHSPEHFFNDSPSNDDRIDNKEKTEDAIMSSSPISVEKIDTPTFTIVEYNDNLNVSEHMSASFRKSYSKLFNSDNQTNAARKVSNSVIISDNVGSKTRTQDVQEKECLELNNSLQCESHTDLELEQIFSTMKLNYNAVTPIPKTPIRVHEEDSRSGPSGPKEKDDIGITSDKSNEFMKKVAELLLLYAQTTKSDTNNEIEELITSLQSLLKSKQTHAQHSIPNTMSNLEKSDNVLSYGDNNLRSLLNPESTKSSVQKYTAILQSKKDENRLTQNMMCQTLLQDENHNQLLRNDNNSILNPSPPNKITKVLNNKQVEKRSHCLSMSVDKNPEQLLNSISEEFATDSGISNVICVGKKTKNKKNSKLEKLKKKLKPKYKIRRGKTPTENLRIKPKQILAIKKNVTVNDTAASLNDKAVYAKAVKIMAEINSQQSAKSANSPPKHTKGVMSPRRSACSEKGIQSNGDNQEYHNCSTTRGKIKLSELGLNTCTVVLIKDPLLLSPRKIENSTTHKAIEDNNSMTYRPKDNNNSSSLTEKEDNNASTHRAKENNDSTTHKAKENNNSTSTKEKEDNNSTTHKAKENNNSSILKAKEDNNATIHRAKEDNNATTHQANKHRANEENNSMTHKGEEDQNFTSHSIKEDHELFDELPRKRRRRSSNEPFAQYKRVLRSDTVHKRLSTEDNIELSNSKGESNRKLTKGPRANDSDTQLLVPNHEKTLHCLKLGQHSENIVSYGDLDIFSEDCELERKVSAPVEGRALINTDSSACYPKESILCRMIEKYGVERVKPFEKKIPDKIVKPISEKIEQEITKIKLMTDTKSAMNSFVADLRKLNYKHFIAGLIDYLMKPERKNELFGKVSSSPAPAMTKAEQILLYVIAHLKTHWPSVDIVDAVLSSIEFALFKLNRTPEFNVIESSSHFYAVLCRYFKAKSRLRLFILDAMYCIQYKSVSLIKQCLDVWMHIIPLAHMGIAKSPMVTCLVYLLHFYKCDDRLNRVQDIRNILIRKYFYQITDWNESKILEMFKNSIKDLNDISLEKKMLRLALVILAKRQGPQWCQTHIIKNLLQPMIEKENVPNNVKEFCVSMIGPLMKPYPADMKVHCEIAINQLVDILNNNPSPKMEEAAITSMIYINRHDQRSINKMLLSRKMKPMSMELQKSIREYVKSKPLKIWKKNLAAIAR